MFCGKCGADIGDAKYCPNCGNSNDPDAPVKGVKTVNKIAYGLIAILIGGLGIHRFYAGKIFSGIIYILFCWTGIPSILGLVEGIIALTREDDGRGNIVVREDSYFV